MNMTVSFNHPTLSNGDIVIFIDSDIPHLITKLLMHYEDLVFLNMI